MTSIVLILLGLLARTIERHLEILKAKVVINCHHFLLK
jgi:hypothetical protein